MGGRIGQEREPEDSLVRRNLACTAAATVVSGKQFRRPGGDLGEGKKGKLERRRRGLNSRGAFVVAVLVSEVNGEINGDGRFPVEE
jgi:hypothetical protein